MPDRLSSKGRTVTVVLLVAILGSMAGTAGDGIAAQTFPDVPPAEDCDAQEVDLSEIELLLEFPVLYIPERPSQHADADPGNAQSGIEELVWTSVSCVNANQPLRWLSLFTEGYWLERFGPNYPDDFAAFRVAASREARPAGVEDQLEILAVDSAMLLEDGRWSTSVTTQNRETRFVDELVVVWDGETWLIDEFRAGEELAVVDGEA